MDLDLRVALLGPYPTASKLMDCGEYVIDLDFAVEDNDMLSAGESEPTVPAPEVSAVLRRK